MNNILVLDIETIPTQRADVREYFDRSLRDELTQAMETVKAPSNYKDEAKIADYIAERRTALQSEHADKLTATVAKTGLSGAFGQVVCIGFLADVDIAPNAIYGLNEREILNLFNAALSVGVRPADHVSTTIVGHNVASFDLRFLLQRYIVNGIRPHPLIHRAAQAKPWESEKVFDTMVQFAGVGNTISLDKLCLALGIEGKGAISGADVWPMVQAGKMEEVARYCENDVRITREVFRRMMFAS